MEKRFGRRLVILNLLLRFVYIFRGHKMKNEIIFLVEDSLEGGYEARALGYSIFTQADSLDELKENIREAIFVHFDSENMPKVIRMHYVKEEIIAS